MENLSDELQGAMWWNEKGKKQLESLNMALSKLNIDNQNRMRKNRYHWQLYRNELTTSTSLEDYASYNFSQDSHQSQETLTINVCKSIVDTAVSKMSANKPRPRVLTENGSWQDFEKAKKLTKFMDGTFNHSKFYEKAPMALMDACIFGTGILKLSVVNNDIEVVNSFLYNCQ